MYLNGKRLVDKDIVEFQNEIKVLEKLRIWRVYTETLRDQAKQRMFEKSVTYDDMWSGKMMLKNWEVVEDINKLIKTWKPIEPIHKIVPKPYKSNER